MEELKAIWRGAKMAHCAQWAVFIAAQLLAVLGFGAEKPARDWSGSLPAKTVEVPVTKIVEKRVEVPVEKIVEVPAARMPLVTWNEEFLAIKELPSTGAMFWLMESHPDCRLCGPNWELVSKAVKAEGYTASYDGQFRKQDVKFDHPLPVWRLMWGDDELDRKVGTADPKTLMDRYKLEFESVRGKAVAAAKSINAGTMAKADIDGYIEKFVKVFGTSGTQTLSNVRSEWPVNGVTAVVPAGLKLTWQLKPSEVKRAHFSPPLSGRWGLVSLSVQDAVYDGQKITFQTPLSAFNPVITVK